MKHACELNRAKDGTCFVCGSEKKKVNLEVVLMIVGKNRPKNDDLLQLLALSLSRAMKDVAKSHNLKIKEWKVTGRESNTNHNT